MGSLDKYVQARRNQTSSGEGAYSQESTSFKKTGGSLDRYLFNRINQQTQTKTQTQTPFQTSKRTRETVLSEMEAAKRNREEATKKRQNYSGKGSWLINSNPEASAAMNKIASADADAEFMRWDDEYNRLRAELYYLENENKLDLLKADPAAADLYDSGKIADEDRKKLLNSLMVGWGGTTGATDEAYFDYLRKMDDRAYLAEKYGTDAPIAQLARINRDRKQAEGALEELGYNMDRLSDYEQRLVNSKNRDKYQEAAKQAATENPGAAWVAARAMSPLQGVDYLHTAAETIGNEIRGEDDWRPVTSDDMHFANFVGDVDQTINQNIVDPNMNGQAGMSDFEKRARNAGGFLYGVGTSIGDMTMAASLLGPGAGVILASGAAAQTSKTVLDNGGTGEQAVLSGAAAGVAEYMFEKTGIDNLLKPKNIGSIKTLVVEAAKQSSIEATEEVLTEISNIITNSIIMGNNSDFDIAVAYYMSYEGGSMTEEEAKKQAILDNIKQIALAGLSGAVAGGLMSGGSGGINLYENARNAYEIYGEESNALVSEALEINPDNRYAAKMQERVDKGEKLTGYQLSKITEQNETALFNQDIENIQASAEQRLIELGETGDAKTIAAAVAKKVAGKKLTPKHFKALQESKYGQQVSDELNPDHIRSGGQMAYPRGF